LGGFTLTHPWREFTFLHLSPQEHDDAAVTIKWLPIMCSKMRLVHSSDANGWRSVPAMRLAEMSLAEARTEFQRMRKADESQALLFALAALEHFKYAPVFYFPLVNSARTPELRRAAVDMALEAAANGVEIEPRLLIAAVKVLRDELAGSARVAEAEALLERVIRTSPRVEFSRALQAQSRRLFSDAMMHVERHLADHPGDREAIVFRGLLAYRMGRWGEHAPAIRALAEFPKNAAAAAAFEAVSDFATACGTTLDRLSAAPLAERQDFQTPGSVFEHAVRQAPPPDRGPRDGIAMVCGSLAAGGRRANRGLHLPPPARGGRRAGPSVAVLQDRTGRQWRRALLPAAHRAGRERPACPRHGDGDHRAVPLAAALHGREGAGDL